MNTTRHQSCMNRVDRMGFTLVELLVVITIIGILAALITAAGAGALKTARKNAIKTELDQITMAFQSAGAFPPNCQVDGTSASGPLIESQVLTDLKRHFKQAFPRHREPEALIASLAGLSPNGTVLTSGGLQGGMTAGEAIVFWLGGFSSDPKYPISGEGGPSYQIDPSVLPPGVTAVQADPIESRKWIFPFEVARLQPRTSDNYFDDSNNRFIQYTVKINGVNQLRRINFWQYVPSKSEQPYLYFDTSRHPASADFDPPAATELAGNVALDVHAIKKRSESAAAALQIEFCNRDKFQVIHCGVDGEWGDFDTMTLAHTPLADLLLFHDGPFTGDVADTLVNFSEGTLEDSQP